MNGEFGNVVNIVNHTSQSTRGLLYFVCGAGNFGKIWSTCGQLEVEYTNCRSNKCGIIVCIILPVHFYEHRVQ
jgi:hypothetical protein